MQKWTTPQLVIDVEYQQIHKLFTGWYQINFTNNSYADLFKYSMKYLLGSGMMSNWHDMSQLSHVPGSHHEFYVVSGVQLGFSREHMHPLKSRELTP